MCLYEQIDIPGVQVDWFGWFWECLVYCIQVPQAAHWVWRKPLQLALNLPEMMSCR